MLEVIKCDYKHLKQKLNPVFQQIPSFDSRKFFIKPNLGGRYPITKGENNGIDSITAICEILINLGVKEIIIAHSSLLGFGYSKYCNFKDLIKINHYDKLRKYSNVRLLNLDDIVRTTKTVNDFTFHVPKLLVDENVYYINLCKMKTHMETTVSLSLKNQMGLVTLNDRKNMHINNLHSCIAALATVIKPDLNIIDGIVGMEGNGPHHGGDKKANLIVVGDNPVKTDTLACYLMGIDYGAVEHIAEAQRVGVGRFIDQSIKMTYADRVVPFRTPDEAYKKGLKFYVWPSTSCSACIFSLSRAFDVLLRRHPLKTLKKLFLDETNVLIGECKGLNIKNRKNICAVGDCCKNIVDEGYIHKHLKGCPPKIEDIVKFLEY